MNAITSRKALCHNLMGAVWIDFREIGSTNEEAHSLALRGFPDGTFITADIQTRGRGRRGNVWHSPEGGLYCSIILRPLIPIKELGIFEKLAVIAVWETIIHFCPKGTTVKEPNDILIQGKKVAGILVEVRGCEKRVDHLVIGIGINCSTTANCLPLDLKDRVTTLSQEAGRYLPPLSVMNPLLNSINRWYNHILYGNKKRVLDTWERLIAEGLQCRNYY